MIVFVIVLSVIVVIQAVRASYLKRNWMNHSNRLLFDILTNAAKQETLHNSANNILTSIKNYFHVNYVTLFTYDKDRKALSLLSTNVEPIYIESLRKRGQDLLNENADKNDAYIECSKNNLYYDSAKERNIKYMFFIKLVIKNETIGAVLVENSTDAQMEKQEVEFFKAVIDSVSIVLQNLIYRRNEIEQSNKDALTGVLNRRMFDQDIYEITEKCSKLGNPYTLAFLDIDHFKKFNDTYGHQCGDLVLQEITGVISRSIRKKDKLYRYGGEEFCIILPEVTPSEIEQRLGTLRSKIENHRIAYKGQELSVTCSFGASGYPQSAISSKDIIAKADKALYKSKEAGRNRVTIL